MYPRGGGVPATVRFSDLCDQILLMKSEFETMENEYNLMKHTKDEYERKLESQATELTTLKQHLTDLEKKHQRIKQQYEDEIARLRRQLENFSNLEKQPNVGQQPISQMNQQSSAQQIFPIQQGTSVFPPLGSHNTLKSMAENTGGKRLDQKYDEGQDSRRLDVHEPKNYPPDQIAQQLPQQPPQQLPPQQQQQQQLPQHPDNKQNPENGARQDSKTDWVVVYNPNVKTNVNINLVHNLDHQSVVCCVKFSNNGKFLATGSNKVAKVFDVETGEKICSFPDESSLSHNLATPDKEDSYVRSVCFSPDCSLLVAGAEDKTVKVWDIKTRSLRCSFQGHELDIYSLDFAPDGRFVVSGSGDGKAKIWNMKTGECSYTLGNDDTGPKEGVTSVAVSPDGKYVAAGSLDYVVRLWDTQTGKFLQHFRGHEDSVYSVAFSPDGKTLASGSLDKTLKLWDLGGRNECINTLTGHRDYVLSVAFAPDGNWLISGSKDRSVQFWDPRNGILHLMLQGHKNSVISVALNPSLNQPMFATGSGDYRARIWSLSH